MPDSRSKRVLYLDDDQGLVRLVQKSLLRLGYEVVSAGSWAAAQAALADGVIDVIALDHDLGSETGLDIIAQLGELPKHPPVVYVTGSSELSVAVAALKAGASDFVPKTVSEDFMALLNSAFRRAIEKERLRERKEQAEAEVRAARDRAELLLQEVNHRIANSLAMAASFVNLQAGSLADGAAKAALEETKNRIHAISLVHRQLYTKGDFRLVELNDYLANLIEQMRASARSGDEGIAIHHDLAHVELPIDASVNLGVIVAEWISNALKYAYPSGQGRIDVTLVLLDDGRAQLTVADRGVGREGDAGRQGTGFGTRIVSVMADSMAGSIDYRRANPGTIAELTFPLRITYPAQDTDGRKETP